MHRFVPHLTLFGQICAKKVPQNQPVHHGKIETHAIAC